MKPTFPPIVRTTIPQQESQPQRKQVPEVPILMEKNAKKQTMTKPRKRKPQKVCRKKQKSTKQRGNERKPDHIEEKWINERKLIELLQGQQEMMMKAEERDRLAMQELMKFEMEAKKSHQDFTLAALKELGNIFNKKD